MDQGMQLLNEGYENQLNEKSINKTNKIKYL